jgi:pimeloyl-ACP methyl ester carboxylesterase
MKMFFGSIFLKDPKRKFLRKIWKNHFLTNNRKGIVKVVKGVIYRQGVTEILSKIPHPTLILVGEKDELTDLNKAEILNRGIKNSELKIIPGAGHMSPVEEPDIVNNEIMDFLGKIRSDNQIIKPE